MEETRHLGELLKTRLGGRQGPDHIGPKGHTKAIGLNSRAMGLHSFRAAHRLEAGALTRKWHLEVLLIISNWIKHCLFLAVTEQSVASS